MTARQKLAGLEVGLEVMAADGESLGTISSIEGQYLVATKGVIFTGTTYIPVATIATVEQDEVRVGLTGGEVRAAAWDQVPDDFHAGAVAPEDAAQSIPQSRSNTAAIRDDQSN